MCIRDRPYADEVQEHTSVYQLNELDFMYRQLSSDMQEEYVSLPVSYTHHKQKSRLPFKTACSLAEIERTSWLAM